MSARENILSRIKQALETPTENPMPKPDFSVGVYAKSEEEYPDVIFAENFKKNNGDFYYCESPEAFVNELRRLLGRRDEENIYIWDKYLQKLIEKGGVKFLYDDTDFLRAEIGITKCEALVARTGSVLISSRQTGGRRLSIYPPVHIVVAFASQLVYNVQEGLALIRGKYNEEEVFPSMISLVTGPSRTADIEKTLVLGAHGPKEIILFFIDDNLTS